MTRLRLTERIEKKEWGEVEKDIKCVSLNKDRRQEGTSAASS